MCRFPGRIILIAGAAGWLVSCSGTNSKTDGGSPATGGGIDAAAGSTGSGGQSSAGTGGSSSSHGGEGGAGRAGGMASANPGSSSASSSSAGSGGGAGAPSAGSGGGFGGSGGNPGSTGGTASPGGSRTGRWRRHGDRWCGPGRIRDRYGNCGKRRQWRRRNWGCPHHRGRALPECGRRKFENRGVRRQRDPRCLCQEHDLLHPRQPDHGSQTVCPDILHHHNGGQSDQDRHRETDRPGRHHHGPGDLPRSRRANHSGREFRRRSHPDRSHGARRGHHQCSPGMGTERR
jgi:hypothetical protein